MLEPAALVAEIGALLIYLVERIARWHISALKLRNEASETATQLAKDQSAQAAAHDRLAARVSKLEAKSISQQVGGRRP